MPVLQKTTWTEEFSDGSSVIRLKHNFVRAAGNPLALPIGAKSEFEDFMAVTT